MSNIYATNVSFNQPLTNIKDIILVNPSDTILNMSCTTLNISGQLVATNMSCKTTANINTIEVYPYNNMTYVNISNSFVPSYGYTLKNGTNIEGSIGYIYSKLVKYTGAITFDTTTNIIVDYNTGLSLKGGCYMVKLDISYRNTVGLTTTTPVKIFHTINSCSFCNIIYFNNTTTNYTYSNTFISHFGTEQAITHDILVPGYLSGISNINVSIVNGEYTISMLKIA